VTTAHEIEFVPADRAGRSTEVWIKIGFAFVAVSQLFTGVWAVADPMGFYRSYPGFGMHWVQANPPFNHHLVVDAASGFLMIGVLAGIGVFVLAPVARVVALVGCLVGLLPHFLFHLTHPAMSLSGLERAESTGGLAFTCFVCIVLLVVVGRQLHRDEGSTPARP
jgi:hypothetical protein